MKDDPEEEDDIIHLLKMKKRFEFDKLLA